jgi:sugar lactone lactonase YvrE
MLRLFFAVALTACAQDDLPAGKGRETLESTCTECHGLDRVVAQLRTTDQWRSIATRMRAKGATMTDDELNTLVEYLSQNLGAVSAPQGWYPPEGGLLSYRANLFFGQEPWTMPEGFAFGRVSSIATDKEGNVYVFHRGRRGDPLIVFDKAGKYLRSWGKGMFVNPHNIRFDPEENLWITDNMGHQVIKCTKDGKVLMTLGIKGELGADEKHFGGPSDIAFAKNGDFYVSDGYQNSRIVRFNKDGKYLMSWGKPGTGPGEFNLVHALAMDSKGNLYASDHRNNRIQIFDPNGKFLRQWTHLGPGQALYMTPKDELFAVMIRSHEENLASVGLAGKIMKIDIETGKILGSMTSPGHSIHVDASYNIWVGSLTGNALKWTPR